MSKSNILNMKANVLRKKRKRTNVTCTQISVCLSDGGLFSKQYTSNSALPSTTEGSLC